MLEMHRWGWAVVAAGAVLLPRVVGAQVVQDQRAQATQYQYANPMGQSLGWLYMTQIQKELEVLPEQREQIDQLRTEVNGKLSELYKSLNEGDRTEWQKKYYEASKELGEETEKKVRQILLPHQINRLKQIALQMKLASAGYGSAYALTTDSDVADELEISEEQKAELRDKEKELQAEIRTKTQEFYKQLNEEAREKLLSVLTPAQRQKLDRLIGDKFEWQVQTQPVEPAKKD
jgi:hypothetical protein